MWRNLKSCQQFSARPETGSPSTPSLQLPGTQVFPSPAGPLRDPTYTASVLSVVSPAAVASGKPQAPGRQGPVLWHSLVGSDFFRCPSCTLWVLSFNFGFWPGAWHTGDTQQLCWGKRREGMSSKAGGQEALESVHCGELGTSHIWKESRGISLAHLSKLW